MQEICKIYIPESTLGQFVDHFIYYEGFEPDHSVDRFLPDGNVEIIIDLKEEPQFIYDNETLRKIQECNLVWASGVRTEPITIPSGKAVSMFIISFNKGMAYPFFPVPMVEVSNRVVDADLIWRDEFTLLREQILGTNELNLRFKLVEKFLLDKIDSNFTIERCVEYAVKEITGQPNQVSLHELYEKIGYSHKHFISMFKSRIGVTPKKFQKIMRFQMAINEIESLKEFDWTSISLNCGYYDQAHFINDFKGFSGFTPQDYYSRKNGQLNYVPVG